MAATKTINDRLNEANTENKQLQDQLGNERIEKAAIGAKYDISFWSALVFAGLFIVVLGYSWAFGITKVVQVPMNDEYLKKVISASVNTAADGFARMVPAPQAAGMTFEQFNEKFTPLHTDVVARAEQLEKIVKQLEKKFEPMTAQVPIIDALKAQMVKSGLYKEAPATPAPTTTPNPATNVSPPAATQQNFDATLVAQRLDRVRDVCAKNGMTVTPKLEQDVQEKAAQLDRQDFEKYLKSLCHVGRDENPPAMKPQQAKSNGNGSTVVRGGLNCKPIPGNPRDRYCS